jgi:hypothetical protein
MKFIRKNGRIIPIREKSNHGSFAAAAAVTGAVTKMAPKAAHTVQFGSKRFIYPVVGNTKLRAGLKIAGAAIFGANVYDSYKHGKETGSATSGLLRYFTNNWAISLGSFAGTKLAGKANKIAYNLKNNKKSVSKAYDYDITKSRKLIK